MDRPVWMCLDHHQRNDISEDIPLSPPHPEGLTATSSGGHHSTHPRFPQQSDSKSLRKKMDLYSIDL
jgi:hypothetical protein